MTNKNRYFFCGIGGSGMLPLALILLDQGHTIEGSDRSLDQGRTPAKFEYLRSRGIRLFPQDGSGVTSPEQIVVASAAVEDTVPDIAAALRVGAKRMSRADMLSALFNAAPMAIGVAGTSGKSTVTGMIAWILHHSGQSPTVMNGAVMKNFRTPEALFSSSLVGTSGIFVSEVDESDGSIAAYNPRVAVLMNIALDHKTMDELRALFGGFAARAKDVVLNLDNPETARLAAKFPAAITYSIEREDASLIAWAISPEPTSVSFSVHDQKTGESVIVRMGIPGRHNVSNALAAIAAVRTCGVTLAQAAAALHEFSGIARRFDIVGTANGVTVIDDFGHNPDKIAATLRTVNQFPGRVLVMFQPHGFGPIKKMRREFAECFAENLNAEDILLMPEPAYFGGTVDRSVGSADLAADICALGRNAEALSDRAACGARLLELAKPGDRILVMGARDDTLTVFAQELLAKLNG
ncbi:MAG TPA: Mur ligase family protein [Hyphomonas sp.]|nr:UDP-N-acetylmuramate--alanine ligase [Hyphomonas sp.]HRJ00580.1 Mur ligase family protein [Hyphomonas sp.]HRK68696.1 Mur ligase family protein [Hyphomonas sp.]